MSPEEKRDLQYRARRAISAPVPKSILSGSASGCAEYKKVAALVGAFVRSGAQIERARVHISRLETMQGLSS